MDATRAAPRGAGDLDVGGGAVGGSVARAGGTALDVALDAAGHRAVDGDGPALPPAVVAARLGVAPATLRTWDRRYGLGPSVRTAGAHRRYGPLDVARLQVMRRLVLDGVPAAEAARVARSAVPHAPVGRDAARTGTAAADAPARDDAVAGSGARAGGGAVLAVGDVADPVARAAARGLARAAQALDADAVVAGIRAQLRERGVEGAWEQVLRPVLRAVGERWASTGEGAEVEHLLSRCAAAALHAHAAGVPRDGSLSASPRPVLLVSAPGEAHELPLHVVACALTERGVGSRLLGASTPAAAVVAAARRTRACGVLVWSQRTQTADEAVLTALPATRPPTAVIAAGPGWSRVPAGAVHVDGLAVALDVLLGVAGARPSR